MKQLLLFFSILVCSPVTEAQTIPNYVPTNNLLGYWPFDGNANDLSPGMHNGIVNGAVPTADRFNVANMAYSFTGANSDNIVVPSHPSLSGFNDLSISVWVNFGQFSGIQNIVAKWYHVLNCGFDNDTYLTAVVDSNLYWNTNNHNVALQSNPPVFGLAKLNQWQHLVFTSSHTQGESIYVNGVLAATYTNNIGTICGSTNPLVFGAGNNGLVLHRFLTGKLDDAGIWDRVLTNCEIQQLYNSSLYPGTFTVTSSSTFLCAGMTATLTASSPGTYTWNNTPGNNTFTINPVVTTTYNVTGPGTVSGCPGMTSFVQQVHLCDGIESNEVSSQILIYPNPAENLLYVNIGGVVSENFKLVLTDLSGKTVFDHFIRDTEVKINTSSITEGVYFIKISDDHGNGIKHARLIITH